jgi:hypothetical protein
MPRRIAAALLGACLLPLALCGAAQASITVAT